MLLHFRDLLQMDILQVHKLFLALLYQFLEDIALLVVLVGFVEATVHIILFLESLQFVLESLNQLKLSFILLFEFL